MKNILSTILIVLLPVCAASSAPKKPPPLPAPLIPSEQIWIFGIIPEDATVCHHYILTNYNPDTVTIIKLVPGCDCTHLPKTPISIASGESYLLRVEFDTKTYFGKTDRDVHIVTDFETNPELDLYFTSVAASKPGSIKITPSSTVFIPGKQNQTFSIENISDKSAAVTIILDNDSSLSISETELTLKGNQKKEITVAPIWERLPRGANHRCLVVEIARDKTFRVTIPVKINKF